MHDQNTVIRKLSLILCTLGLLPAQSTLAEPKITTQCQVPPPAKVQGKVPVYALDTWGIDLRTKLGQLWAESPAASNVTCFAKIKQDGSLEKLEIIKSSGVSAVNEKVLALVQRCFPRRVPSSNPAIKSGIDIVFAKYPRVDVDVHGEKGDLSH